MQTVTEMSQAGNSRWITNCCSYDTFPIRNIL